MKEIVDSIITQLETTKQVEFPTIEKVLGQVNEVDNTVKVTLILEEPTGDKVSVVAIAPIDKQVDPIIESVKPITPEIVDKIEEVVTAVPLPEPIVPKTCSNTTINSAGQ